MYKHVTVHTRLNDVRTRSYHYLYIPCTYHVHTCIYIYRNIRKCMYMFMFFNNCIYHVCQPLYTSIVHKLYIHGSDMSVHVYARWSGFQMAVDICTDPPLRWCSINSFLHTECRGVPWHLNAVHRTYLQGLQSCSVKTNNAYNRNNNAHNSTGTLHQAAFHSVCAPSSRCRWAGILHRH